MGETRCNQKKKVAVDIHHEVWQQSMKEKRWKGSARTTLPPKCGPEGYSRCCILSRPAPLSPEGSGQLHALHLI